ncbi:MAG: alkaline phosphatase D family protein [Planctomycetaceae bacterium]|nr:alkaline phosphatase D family protein [Planctomycetaceae bacterium]
MTRLQVVGMLIGVLTCGTLAGQPIDDYDLGGASRPKPDFSFRKEDQYKRVHQASLRFILQGERQRSEEFLENYLIKHPGDAETLYMLGVLQAQAGDGAKAETYLQRSLEAGLPPGRLVAGPRKLLEPLRQSDLLQKLFRTFGDRPVHGPLLGNVTASRASFWVRTATESDVQVMVSTSANFERPVYSQPANSHARDDYTAVVTVDGLEPTTQYHYAVRIGDGVWHYSDRQQFETFANAGRPGKFTVAFGGGAGYVPHNERMWNTISDCDPNLLLLLGDNVYIDDPESVLMQQYTYQRRQSRPEWRALTASVPVYTIWDDHDFSTNDSWGGPDVSVPFWKKDWVFPIYRQNWVNPAYGGGDAQPGCWYSFSVGDVEFIMLDCRYYRTSPRKTPRSMLGPVQLAWLKQELQQSTARVKVLCSSVPWDFRTKGDSLDTWNGYKQEHEQILSFIEQQQIEGVLLVSADRHRSDAWKIERPNGYGFYEFNSSRLTNQHVHPTMEKKGAIFSYNKLQSFGLITFDTAADDPTVTYEIVNIDGARPHSLTVRLSELSF